MTVQADSGKLTPLGEAVEADTRGRLALSHAIGIDPTTLWRWMTGRSRPQSAAMQRQAALALGRSVEELFPVEHDAERSHTGPSSNDGDLSRAA